MKILQHRKLWEGGLLIAVALCLTIGSFSLLFLPAPRFSPEENRYLAAFPTFSAEALTSGSYAADIDVFAAERMAFRTPLRHLRSFLQKIEGRLEFGGAILCQDGSLTRPITVNERALAQNLAALQKIVDFSVQKSLPVSVAVPTTRLLARATVLPHLYDNSAAKAAGEALIRAFPHAQTFPTLTDSLHWYRTDHHWTTAGAYAAYCALSAVLGYTPYPQEAFDVQTVSKSFLGTAHSAAGLPFVTPDHIELYRYENDTAFSVFFDGKQAPFDGFYDFERLSTKDGYGVFFGGNHGRLEISSDDKCETLLVIKDSFANALLPFLARHYHIVAIDPRYTAAPLSDCAVGVDRVLVLCGLQSLCESPLLRPLIATQQ